MEHQDGTFRSYLEEKGGVEKPPVVDPNAVARFKSRKRKQKVLTAKDYVQGIRSGNRTLLSQAITIVESNLQEHYELAQEIITECLPFSGNSIRIGITGVPGAGKSTFIESFGKYITQKKHSLAVLAIDPSSERTKGSILGDKTRMVELSVDENAYIRPSPSAGSLGGVARKTRESIILCEAAGFDVIFVETVGVGQSETAVHSMVDFFLLLMLAGAGDELQGIKRGIMEMADSISITKADGSNIDKAKVARSEYQTALSLFPPHPSGVTQKVTVCSALEKRGLSEIWKIIEEYVSTTKHAGFFEEKRNQQAKYWMYESIHEQLQRNFYSSPKIQKHLAATEQKVIQQQKSSFVAAQELLDIYFQYKEKS
ncbi:MAG: methylmalonyl Co-A mutase-associated GTPase MeaB [Bacteroidales bacterium]|nr:methylmalonyl Co-A mutase-associated GTPase MeaB [Bacteroidales bacterium]NLK80892.1 methylmalonyl Co-A mutase-associated GTPase MeaB [Bacteroidales bacterium]HPY81772.1 methylmalonyl Co-A mutase-associated GTPase MeaB [Bacteroidales bacterium]